MFGLGKVELVLYAIAAVCVLGLGVVVNKWRIDSAQLKVTARELVDEKAARARDAETYAKNQAKTEDHGNAFDQAIEDQRAHRDDTPTQPVRLCKQPRLPATGDAAHADHAQGGTELPQAARRDPEEGPDVGPELYALADRCDELAISNNAKIDWINDE